MEQTYQKSIHLVSIFAILSFLTAMAYTPKLWITNSEFPKIPRYDFIPIPQHPWDYIMAILLVALLITFLFKPKKYVGIAIITLYIAMAMIDQNRLQPYFYESILIILIVSYLRKGRKNATLILHCLMLIFIATYFWSGIHKLNANFNAQWMHALQKHFSFVPVIIRIYFTYSIALTEALIGLLLLFNRTRKLGVILITLMHTTIVGTLLWLGYGFNVIPWNLQNILSVIVLFWGYKSENTLAIFDEFFNYKKTIIIILVFVLPATNILFGFWDHLLSFSFFSSKLNYYYIEIIDDDLYENIPENFKKYEQKIKNKRVIYLNSWEGAVNQVLLYPEDRVAKKINQYLKSFAKNPKKEGLTKMVEYNHELLNKIHRKK